MPIARHVTIDIVTTSLYACDVSPAIIPAYRRFSTPSPSSLPVRHLNILVTAKDGQILQQKINRITNELHSWFYANSLTLNAEITIAMPFHTRQERDLVKLQMKFSIMDTSFKSETKFLSTHTLVHT